MSGKGKKIEKFSLKIYGKNIWISIKAFSLVLDMYKLLKVML